MPISKLNDKSVFSAAREIPCVDARQEYLLKACGDDTDQIDRVTALLRGFEKESQFLESPAVDLHLTGTMQATLDNSPTIERPGTRIGPYTIRELLGEGGMGVVYVAEQKEPVRRKVALKIIKPGMDSTDVLARFEAERQALAMMSHPNIAKIFDGGTTETGRPYFVMELVKGVAITEFCDDQKLNLRERLELFVIVCQAVQHAHLKGIIHRDLKPSNVLVELHDVAAIPKVIDFGVAKAINQQLTQRTIYTQFSQLVGTPLYMSPEQAQLSGLDIDTRSDVYSLGVLLYELLTDSTPFDKDALSAAGFDEMRRIIREDEPPRPSHRISTLKAAQRTTLSQRRQTDAPQIHRQVQRELDWIVMKALEKDRTRRYESASALAADLQRYLDGDLVQACPPSAGYRLQKYAKRHKGLLTTAGLLVATMLIATGVSVSYAMQADSARDESDQEKNKAIAAKIQAEKNLTAALDAVDKLLMHASSPELAEVPQAQPIRRDILEDVLKFYSQFSITTGDSPEISYRAAMTWDSLAGLEKQQGNIERSHKSYDEMLLRAETLTAEFPRKIEYQRLLRSANAGLGNLHTIQLNDYGAAHDYFMKALNQMDRLLVELPENADDWNRLKMFTYRDMAVLARKQNDNEAEQKYALASYNLNTHPDDVLYCALRLAESLSTSDPELAGKYYLESIAAGRLWRQQNAGRSEMNGLLSSLTSAFDFFRQRDPSQAAEFISEAVDVSEMLASNFPSVLHFPTMVRQCNRRVLQFIYDADLPREAVYELQETYLQNHPDTLTAHEIRARLLSDIEDPIPALTKAINEFPAYGGYYEARGMLLFHQDRGDEAMADVRKALLKTPDPGELGNRVIRMTRELGDSGRWADALATAKFADEQRTESYRVKLALCEANLGLRQYDEALLHINHAIARAPDKGWLYKSRALANFHLNGFADALSDLNTAVESMPGELRHVVTYIPLSEVAKCDNAEFRAGMLKFANRVVELDNQSPGSVSVRTQVCLALGEWELARTDLDAVIDSEDATYYPLYQAALLSLVADDLPRYEQICARMLEAFTDSKTPNEIHFAAWTSALAADAIEDYAPAIQLARQAAEQSPDKQQYLGGLGAILMRSGQYAEAKIELEKALAVNELDGTSPSYTRYFLAMTEHHLGEQQAAKGQLQAANTSADEELAGSPSWNRKLTLELLRKEAETLIEKSNEDN